MPQYEIESVISYFGSYSDDIVTGSMLPYGSRSYIGSFISGNLQFRSATTVNQYSDLYKGREAGSFSRNIRYFSKEIMYDSLIPDIFQIYIQNGGKFVFSDFDATFFPLLKTNQILKFIFGTYGAVVTASDSTVISDNKWMGSYPFINDYSGIRRMLNPDTLPYNSSQFVEFFSTSLVPLKYFPVSASAVSSSNLYYLNIAYKTAANFYRPFISYDIEGFVATNDTFSSFALSQSQLRNPQLYKIIFGSKVNFEIKINNIVEFDVFVPSIRGWKYGLINAFQTKTSAIFRRGRFGQFRDMLEQRPYTKNYVREDGTIDSPIKISFVSGSDAAVTASNPSLNTRNSGIFDYEYKGSAPFTD